MRGDAQEPTMREEECRVWTREQPRDRLVQGQRESGREGWGREYPEQKRVTCALGNSKETFTLGRNGGRAPASVGHVPSGFSFPRLHTPAPDTLNLQGADTLRRLQNSTQNQHGGGRRQMGVSGFKMSWRIQLRNPGSQLRRKKVEGELVCEHSHNSCWALGAAV